MKTRRHDVDQVLSALAEPTRRVLVERLGAGPASVSDLAKPFGITFASSGRWTFASKEKSSFRYQGGTLIRNDCTYQDIVANQRIIVA